MGKFFNDFKAGFGFGSGVTLGSMAIMLATKAGIEAYDRKFGKKETPTPELATEPKTGDDGSEEVK